MIIVLEKEGVKRRVLIKDHIAQRDRIEVDDALPRVAYHRTGRTIDGHPVFEYRGWVSAVCSTAYEMRIGRFRLRVFRWKGDSWLATCEGLFSRQVLEARSLDDAKAEAVALVRNILNKILIDMESLPCR